MIKKTPLCFLTLMEQRIKRKSTKMQHMKCNSSFYWKYNIKDLSVFLLSHWIPCITCHSFAIICQIYYQCPSENCFKSKSYIIIIVVVIFLLCSFAGKQNQVEIHWNYCAKMYFMLKYYTAVPCTVKYDFSKLYTKVIAVHFIRKYYFSFYFEISC